MFWNVLECLIIQKLDSRTVKFSHQALCTFRRGRSWNFKSLGMLLMLVLSNFTISFIIAVFTPPDAHFLVATMSADRWGTASDAEVQNIVENTLSESTKKAIKSTMKAFLAYCQRYNIDNLDLLLDIDPAHLSPIIQAFLINARTVNGDFYQPDSLKKLLSNIRTWLFLKHLL